MLACQQVASGQLPSVAHESALQLPMVLPQRRDPVGQWLMAWRGRVEGRRWAEGEGQIQQGRSREGLGRRFEEHLQNVLSYEMMHACQVDLHCMRRRSLHARQDP